MKYWLDMEYLGLGCSAVSYLDNRRMFNHRALGTYIKCLEEYRLPVAETESLRHEARFREAFVMSLRMCEGADMKRLYRNFGIDPLAYYSGLLQMLEDNGLLTVDTIQGRIRLTKKGQYISNYVLSHLV
jgi:oxygen-independent coproporphyrinogen-3 oxidase